MATKIASRCPRPFEVPHCTPLSFLYYTKTISRGYRTTNDAAPNLRQSTTDGSGGEYAIETQDRRALSPFTTGRLRSPPKADRSVTFSDRNERKGDVNDDFERQLPTSNTGRSKVLSHFNSPNSQLDRHSRGRKADNSYLPRDPARSRRTNEYPSLNQHFGTKWPDDFSQKRHPAANGPPSSSSQSQVNRSQANYGGPLDIAQVSRSQRRTKRATASDRVDHIPFEGKAGSQTSSDVGSTMTPRETRLLKQLWARKEDTTQSSTAIQTVESPQTSLAQQALSIADANALSMPDWKLERVNSAPPIIARQTTDHFTVYQQRLALCNSDMKVWDLLDAYVFQRLEAMNLDGLHPNASRSKHATWKDSRDAVEQSDQSFKESLPYYLTTAVSRLQKSFPSSQLALAIIPYLKNLGPSAFALGASTRLFNHRMEMIFEKSCNLDDVLETLKQMDDEVYEFDENTAHLLDRICNTNSAASRGHLGAGHQAMWTTDRKVRAMKKIHAWKEIVEERLKDQALRRAREEEALREQQERDSRRTAMA